MVRIMSKRTFAIVICITIRYVFIGQEWSLWVARMAFWANGCNGLCWPGLAWPLSTTWVVVPELAWPILALCRPGPVSAWPGWNALGAPVLVLAGLAVPWPALALGGWPVLVLAGLGA